MTKIAAADLSLSQLVTLYNAYADKSVKKFSTKPEAVRRVEALAGERVILKLEDGAFGFVEPTPAVKEEPVVEIPAPQPAAVGADTGALKRRGPAPTWADSAVITVLKANPKRVGSASHARFALYTDGMTVRAYLEAAAALQGGKPEKYRPDVAWDHEHGFIASVPAVRG